MMCPCDAQLRTAPFVRTAKSGHPWFVSADQIYDQAEVRRVRAWIERLRLQGTRTATREWISVDLPLRSGLRVSEVAGLRCEDLYLTGDCPFIHVRQGKGDKARNVLIGQDLQKQLLWYLEWKRQTGESTEAQAPVIQSRYRRPVSTRGLQDIFKRTLNRAKIQKNNNYHMARHTYATHLIVASKENWAFVRDQLGHSSILVTQVYRHLIPGEAQKALERLYK